MTEDAGHLGADDYRPLDWNRRLGLKLPTVIDNGTSIIAFAADEERLTITVTNKATGRVATMRLDDAGGGALIQDEVDGTHLVEFEAHAVAGGFGFVNIFTDTAGTRLYIVNSNPNGVISGPYGSLAIEITTPKLYFNVSGTTTWVQYPPGFLTGTADPSAGGGVAAPVGSFYGRDNSGAGEAWLKTAAADTAWTRITVP